VVGLGGVTGGSVGSDVDDGAGEGAVGAVFDHFVPLVWGGEDLGDGAGSSPCDDVLCTSSCGVDCVWVGGTYIFTLSPTANVAGTPCLSNRSLVVCCMKVR